MHRGRQWKTQTIVLVNTKAFNPPTSVAGQTLVTHSSLQNRSQHTLDSVREEFLDEQLLSVQRETRETVRRAQIQWGSWPGARSVATNHSDLTLSQ